MAVADPNYFGEITFWWGAFLSGAALFEYEIGGVATVASPLLTMCLLLGVSGIPLAEGKHLKRFYSTPERAKLYDEYFKRTSPLIPLPPACYRALPELAKCFCCFEFPSYAYRPRSDDAEEPMASSSTSNYDATTAGSGSGADVYHSFQGPPGDPTAQRGLV